MATKWCHNKKYTSIYVGKWRFQTKKRSNGTNHKISTILYWHIHIKNIKIYDLPSLNYKGTNQLQTKVTSS